MASGSVRSELGGTVPSMWAKSTAEFSMQRPCSPCVPGISAHRSGVENFVFPARSGHPLKQTGALYRSETTMADAKHSPQDLAATGEMSPLKLPQEPFSFATLEEFVSELQETYNVAISPPAMTAAAVLSKEYLPGESLTPVSVEILRDACIQSARNLETQDALPPVPVTACTPYLRQRVEPADVVCAISNKTGIDIKEKVRTWLNMATRELKQAVLGHDLIVDQLAGPLECIRMGAHSPYEPAAILAFAGPPGVGKLPLAKALARTLGCRNGELLEFDFGREDGANVDTLMARLATMSPPGPHPHPLGARKVVVLSRVNAAPPNTLHALVPVLNIGRILMDGRELADHRNTLFVLTFDLTNGGYHAAEEHLQAQLPAGVRRAIQGPYLFGALNGHHIKNIVQRGVQDFCRELIGSDVGVTIDGGALDILARLAHTPEGGVKHIARVLAESALQAGRQFLPARDLSPDDTIHFEADQQQVVVRVTRGAE